MATPKKKPFRTLRDGAFDEFYTWIYPYPIESINDKLFEELENSHKTNKSATTNLIDLLCETSKDAPYHRFTDGIDQLCLSFCENVNRLTSEQLCDIDEYLIELVTETSWYLANYHLFSDDYDDSDVTPEEKVDSIIGHFNVCGYEVNAENIASHLEDTPENAKAIEGRLIWHSLKNN